MKTTLRYEPKVYIIRGHGREYDTNVNIMKQGILIEKIPELFQCFSSKIVSAFTQNGIVHLWATHELGPVPSYGDVFIFSRYRTKYVIDFIGISSEDVKCPSITRKIFLDQRKIWEYVFLLKPIKLSSSEKEEISNALYRLSFEYLNDPLKHWSCSKSIPISLFIGNLKTKRTVIKIIKESINIAERARTLLRGYP